MTRATRSKTILHANGALETVFPLNPQLEESSTVAEPSQRRQRKKKQVVEPPPPPPPPPIAIPEHPHTTPLGRTPRSRRHQPDPAAALEVQVTAEYQVPNTAPHHESDDPFVCHGSQPVPRMFTNTQAAQTPVRPPHRARFATPDSSRSSGSPRLGRHSTSQASTQKKRKGAKDIWPFYRITATDERVCTFCELSAKIDPDSTVCIYGKSTGTSNLRHHLFTDHLDDWVSACDNAKPAIPITAKEAQAAVARYRARTGTEGAPGTEQAGKPKVPVREFSTEAFADACVDWIVADDQALNTIENPYLRALFLMLKKDLKDREIPHRTHLRALIMEKWEKHLKGLEKDLKNAVGRISFTSDIWSDPNLAPFMAVTGHWIESKTRSSSRGPQLTLHLRSELLGFHRIPGRHDGEHLSECFLHIVDRLNITKIGWCTLDNASNNNTFMEHLEEKLVARGVTSFLADENHIRCFPHVVNISSQAVLEAVTDVNYIANTGEYNGGIPGKHDVIAAIRAIIRAVRASSLRRDQFSNVQKNLNMKILQLIQDVKTRWSSTSLMIDRALKNRKAIEVFLSSNRDLQKYKMTAGEWDALKAYHRILLVPHAFQQKLSAEKTPTLFDVIPSFQKMIDAWERQQSAMPEFYDVIEAGLEKLRDYQNKISTVPAYKLAIVLHPSMKLKWFTDNQPYEAAEVKELLMTHLEPYHRRSNSTPRRSRGTPRRTPARPRQEVLDDSDDEDWANNVLGIQSARANTDADRSLEAEIAAYEIDQQNSASVLSYWQENQLRFPTLFRLAMDILPIQGSSVPCERVFSSSKETMSARRNRIAPDLMEALQMLKFTFRRGPGDLNFTKGLDRNEELTELEGHTEDHFSIPSDIAAFVDSLHTTVESDDDTSGDEFD